MKRQFLSMTAVILALMFAGCAGFTWKETKSYDAKQLDATIGKINAGMMPSPDLKEADRNYVEYFLGQYRGQIAADTKMPLAEKEKKLKQVEDAGYESGQYIYLNLIHDKIFLKETAVKIVIVNAKGKNVVDWILTASRTQTYQDFLYRVKTAYIDTWLVKTTVPLNKKTVPADEMPWKAFITLPGGQAWNWELLPK